MIVPVLVLFPQMFMILSSVNLQSVSSAMSVLNLILLLQMIRAFHARAREVLQVTCRCPPCPLGLSPRVLITWLNLDVGSVVAAARRVRETGDAADLQREKEWARQR